MGEWEGSKGNTGKKWVEGGNISDRFTLLPLLYLNNFFKHFIFKTLMHNVPQWSDTKCI